MRAAKLSRVESNMEKSRGQFCDLRGDPKSKGCELLIDTGTYLTYIPRHIFE